MKLVVRPCMMKICSSVDGSNKGLSKPRGTCIEYEGSSEDIIQNAAK